jgi:predicted Zn-ribbon and HTH transcriptional regulator
MATATIAPVVEALQDHPETAIITALPKVDYRYRRANKTYLAVRRAALHCYDCGKTSRGRDIQHWKCCPYCGAAVEKQPHSRRVL